MCAQKPKYGFETFVDLRPSHTQLSAFTQCCVAALKLFDFTRRYGRRVSCGANIFGPNLEVQPSSLCKVGSSTLPLLQSVEFNPPHFAHFCDSVTIWLLHQPHDYLVTERNGSPLEPEMLFKWNSAKQLFNPPPPLKQTNPLGQLFSPKISHFFKTAVLTLEMDIFSVSVMVYIH